MNPFNASSRATVRAGDVAAWRGPLAVLVLVWAATLALFWDTAVAMVTIWYRSETFNHCFLVLPISLWLVWRQRAGLAPMRPAPSPWVLVVVAAFAAAWLLGDMVAVNSVTQLAFVALLVLSVPAILGLRIAHAITFPLAFLFFSVPIGEFLMPQLMESTADFTVAALRWSGVPVLREGLLFVIPTGNWSVVEACSGVRYLIASLTVGTLFAYLNYRSMRKRLAFVLVSLVVPIIANWMRAYMIVMLGHLSDNRLAVGVDHLIYGWVFFGIVILLMFIIGARWAEVELPLSGNPESSAALLAEPRSGIGLAAVTTAFVLLLALPHGAHWMIRQQLVGGVPQLVAPPELGDAWMRLPTNPLAYRPAFRNAAVEFNEAYQGPQGVVGLYVGYYRNQDYDHKLVTSDNALVTSSDAHWASVRASMAPAAMGGATVPVRSMELRRLDGMMRERDARLMVWQVYWIDGELTANDYMAKLYSAWKRLSGHGDESAVIVAYADKAVTDAPDAALNAFIAANHGAIQAVLKQARDSK